MGLALHIKPRSPRTTYHVVINVLPMFDLTCVKLTNVLEVVAWTTVTPPPRLKGLLGHRVGGIMFLHTADTRAAPNSPRHSKELKELICHRWPEMAWHVLDQIRFLQGEACSWLSFSTCNTNAVLLQVVVFRLRANALHPHPPTLCTSRTRTRCSTVCARRNPLQSRTSSGRTRREALW